MLIGSILIPRTALACSSSEACESSCPHFIEHHGTHDGLGASIDGIVSKNGPVTAIENPGLPQTLCPVRGNPVRREFYADFEGKRVYFCCQGCRSSFLDDPEWYMTRIRDEGIVLESAPNAREGGQKENICPMPCSKRE
jgi:YHS domain-containing protein